MRACGFSAPGASPGGTATLLRWIIRLTLCAAASLLLCSVAGVRCRAQSPEPPQEDIMQRDIPSKPITLGDMVNRGLFAIAREVFSRNSVSQMHDEDFGAPKRGVQVDLFTPGDAGVTVRYRW